MPVGDRAMRMDVRGHGHATYTCPATGVCQHVVAAGLWLVGEAGRDAADPDGTAALRAELLALDDATLAAHAGKADRVLVVELDRPRATYRYAGGGLADSRG